MSEYALLIDAIRDLTREIAAYRKVKERGIRLAEEMEAERRSYRFDTGSKQEREG